MATVTSGGLADAIKALKILKNVVTMVPLLGEQVGAGIELAISICEMAQSAKVNKAAYEELGLRIATLLAGISNVVQKAPVDRLPSIRGNLEDVIKVLTEAQNTVRTQTTASPKSPKSPKKFFRVFKGLRAENDLEEISSLQTKISTSLERFQIESNIRLELVAQYVTEKIDTIRETQERATRDADLARLKELSYVPSARYDSDELQDQVMMCLEGTRVALLEDLDAWASSPTTAPFFWLNGLAGTGKSTVARTFCEHMAKLRSPPVRLATFFVSRHSADRRKPVNILHTLVHQLAAQDGSFRSKLTQALADEPDLLSRSLGHQVTKLLVGAFAGLEPSRPVILVLDALDECEADALGREGGQLLALLAQAVDASASFVKLLVTSRLEPTIRKMFDEIQSSSELESEVLRLHDIDRTIVRNDIRQYLVHSFRSLAVIFKANDWPNQDQLELLLDNADVLFIYAATVIRYIGHRLHDPRKRLEQVLARAGGPSKSAYRHLDVLYQGVLANAIPVDDDEGVDELMFTERLRMVLGIVVLAMHPLSPSSIAGLLGWSVHETEVTLAQLSAVLIVHNDEPVRIFHPSFPDFLLDVSRCVGTRLHVDAGRHHSVLARCCLTVMNSLLHKDMLETGLDPLIANQNISEFDTRLVERLSYHLRYSICFWMQHLIQSVLDDDIVTALDSFCRQHLFHWLECLSYLGQLDAALSTLPLVLKRLDDSQLSKELLTDVYHTMRDYCPVIRALGAHVYHSTLVSMPSCRLRDLSSHEAGDVVLRTPRRGGFSREFTYMQGNITEPQLLVLSQDGSRIACCTNGSIYFGNTISGQMTVVAASVPLHPPLALVFSADGRQLLAADRHGHIHVIELNGLESTWADLPPAEQIHESTYAEGAVFSPDGNYCVFQIKSLTTSSYVADGPDPALFLRQVQANTPLYLLDDPGVFFYSLPVAFTPNNQYLIQACNWTIEIWDVARRILHVQGVQDHSVHDEESSIKAVVAVSNTICASLASDGAVLIWNINEGSILRKVLNADHSIDQVSLYSYPLALSTSCSGSLLGVVVKNTVTILDIAAEAPAVARHTFPADRSGYWSRTSIVLDESRSRMYVAGYGEPLLGWDYRAVLHPLQASTTSPGTVQCVSFSGDGCWLVSGTANGYLTIWQTDSGSQIAEHSGEGAVFAAAISSPDPKITLSIRSVSDDVTSPTLRFQASDTWTGEPKEVYGFRPPPVADVSVISPDGRFIALSMRFHSHGDRAILLIDASSGKTIVHVPDDDRYAYCNELVYTPDGHSLIDRRPYSVLIRDAQSLEVRHTCYPSGLLGVRAATMVSPCSSRVGLICQDRLRLCFQAWDIKSGAKVIDRAQLQPLEGLSHFKYPNQIDVCQWTPDHLVYVIQDCVATWDFDTSTPAAIHAWSETWTPNSICMSDDGSFFYAWCEDQRIRAWALASFDMERPLMELDTSTWTEKPTRWDLRCWFLISASHDDTSLHMLVRAQNIHVALKADLMTGHCVDIIPLGEQGSISAANVSFTESKMYVHCPQNTKGAYLLPWLAQIPFGEGGITAEWPQTAGDAFSLLQQALLQVWDPKTGEMKAVILWTEDGTRREVIPPSSPLRSPPNQGIQDRSLRIDYDPYSPLLHIHSTFLPKTHVVSLGIPPDRRPVGSGENREPIAIHEFLIAIGSTHGTVSIFDIEKAVEIAEATGPKESLEREDLKRDVDGMSC